MATELTAEQRQALYRCYALLLKLKSPEDSGQDDETPTEEAGVSQYTTKEGKNDEQENG